MTRLHSTERRDGPHIGINAHLLSGEAGYRRAGIHHYIYQTLRHLPPGDDGRLYTIYTRQTEGWEPRPDFRLRATPWPTEKRSVRIAWEQTIWPLVARRDRLSLLHGMAFALPRPLPCPGVVTVYDLSFVHYPESFPPRQRDYLNWQTARSCRLAARVIAISESGRQDVHRVYGVPLERIDVVTPGVSDVYRPLPAADVAAFRDREQLRQPFLLHVGTLQPRKNIPVLLEAVARLRRPDLSLVLVGGRGWYYDEIFRQVKALDLEQQVRFAGYVDDADLPLWYNAAAAVVVPSLYEGFGLPVTEALACGAPVVAADTSSLPEAGGEAALYFAPRSADDLAAALARVLDDGALRRQLCQAGPKQAARFSWARAGQALAEVYERALAAPEPAGVAR